MWKDKWGNRESSNNNCGCREYKQELGIFKHQKLFICPNWNTWGEDRWSNDNCHSYWVVFHPQHIYQSSHSMASKSALLASCGHSISKINQPCLMTNHTSDLMELIQVEKKSPSFQHRREPAGLIDGAWGFWMWTAGVQTGLHGVKGAVELVRCVRRR